MRRVILELLIRFGINGLGIELGQVGGLESIRRWLLKLLALVRMGFLASFETSDKNEQV